MTLSFLYVEAMRTTLGTGEARVCRHDVFRLVPASETDCVVALIDHHRACPLSEAYTRAQRPAQPMVSGTYILQNIRAKSCAFRTCAQGPVTGVAPGASPRLSCVR